MRKIIIIIIIFVEIFLVETVFNRVFFIFF